METAAEHPAIEQNIKLAKQGVETYKHRKDITLRATTNLALANEWLGDQSTALNIYDDYINRYMPKGIIERWRSKKRVDSQRLSQLVAGSVWASEVTGFPPRVTFPKVEHSYEEAKKDFYSDYSADVAVIAENCQVPVRQVMDLVKELKNNEQLKKVNVKRWSTAITIASAVFSEGIESKQKMIDKYLKLDELTQGKLSEASQAALFQAVLIKDENQVVARYNELKSQKIAPTLFGKETVTFGSKAFLVLAEAVGNLDESLTVESIRNLVKKKKLPQDVAARFLLSYANSRSNAPVLCRQGVTNDGETGEYETAMIGTIPHQTYVETEVKYNYTVALKLKPKAR